MNILFANEYFVPFAPGGAEWSLYYWIRILADRGHRIAVVTPDLSGEPGAFIPEDEGLTQSGRVEIIRFPFRKTLPMPPRVFPSYVFGNPVFTKYYAGRILKTAASFHPDILFAQGYDAISAVAEAGLRSGIPTACTIRDYRAVCPISICLHRRDYAPAQCTLGDYHLCLKDYYAEYGRPSGPYRGAKAAGRRLLEWGNMQRVRRFLKKMNGAAFVSEGIRQIYLRSQLAPDLSAVVHNPLPDSAPLADAAPATERYGLSAGRYFLFVGRFSIGKGAEVMAKAMPMIRRQAPDATVVVAGNREYETNAEGFRFVGHVDRQTLASLYAGCLAVLLPSRWQEPFSRVLLESAHAKAPVVATCAGGNPEAVEEGVNGFLVSRNDPAAFAEACVRILKLDPSARRRMGQAGARLCRDRFSSEVLSNRMELFMAQAAAGRRR